MFVRPEYVLLVAPMINCDVLELLGTQTMKRQLDVRYFLYQRRRQWRIEDKVSSAGRMTPLFRVKFETKKTSVSHLILKAATHLVRVPAFTPVTGSVTGFNAYTALTLSIHAPLA